MTCRLTYLTVQKFRVVVETRRNRAIIVRNRCVPVCGHRARYLGLGVAHLQAQLWFEIEDSRLDPSVFGWILKGFPAQKRRFPAGSLSFRLEF